MLPTDSSRPSTLRPMLLAVLASLLPLACAGGGGSDPLASVECEPDDGGLTLPPDFCAVVVADSVDAARHLAVAPNGDLYAAVYGRGDASGGVVALRDTTGDGRADVREKIPGDGGTGISLRGEHLYFAPDWGVVRYRRPAGQLVPETPPDTIVSGLRSEGGHAAKTAVIDDDGFLYVNIGAPSNACQEDSRSAGSPGQDPCPQLEENGGIWRFHADSVGQTQEDGLRFATGLRNTFALDINPANGDLYGGMHGRDQLHGLWPDLFSQEQSVVLPSEEILRINEGDDFGWPYCYHDWQQDALVLSPEYGGDGQEVGRCADKEGPVVAFPGHWAPNGLAFYPRGGSFPADYHGGAFVAWHGSWNRAPAPQAGYKVSYIPWDSAAAELSADYRADWATGFPGGDVSPRGAAHRPSGVAVGPHGSLFVSDDQAGRIWRIIHRPEAEQASGGG